MKRVLFFLVAIHCVTTIGMNKEVTFGQQESSSSYQENQFINLIASIKSADTESIKELLLSPYLEVAIQSDNEELRERMYDLLVAYNNSNQCFAQPSLNFRLSKMILALNSQMLNKQKKQAMTALDESLKRKGKKQVDGFQFLPASESPEVSDEENLSIYDTVYLAQEAIKKNQTITKVREVTAQLEQDCQSIHQKVNAMLELKLETGAMAGKDIYSNEHEIQALLQQNITHINEHYNKNKSRIEKIVENIKELSLDNTNAQQQLEEIKLILQKKRDNCWKMAQQLSHKKKELSNRNGMLSAHEQLLNQELLDARMKREALMNEEIDFNLQEKELVKKLERIRKATFALGTLAADEDIRLGKLTVNNENLRKL